MNQVSLPVQRKENVLPFIVNYIPYKRIGQHDETPPTDEERTIRFEFTIAVKDDESLIGQKEFIGSALTIGSLQIWAGQLEIEIVNRTDRNLTLVGA